MRNTENINNIAALGIDWIGLIFWTKSPRYVNMNPAESDGLTNHTIRDAICNISAVKRVGVFVDDTVQNITTQVRNYKLDIIQLHGNETPAFINNLRAKLQTEANPDIKFIKAISVTSDEDIGKCCNYENSVDYFLFDTRCSTVGGSGIKFDWSILNSYHGNHPFLLSGGIGPDDADTISSIHHPMLAGIDLNSRFETEPGMKDVIALHKFIDKIRTGNNIK